MTRADLEIDADRVDELSCSGCGTAFAVDAFPPLSSVRCPACGEELVVPARLGSFLLLETLGRGGMGAVYKALDETLHRHVAIKVLRKEYGDDEKFLADFLKEARAAAALNHGNVAGIYSYGQEKGQPYIVMELLEGGRLDRMIETARPLDEVFVMEVAEHIAEGMEAAYEIGLRHGDIKPANILFDDRGTAKVVDFGLASFADSHHARPGEVWGTPYYIPPETVKGKAADHRGDIYSLGGTIFHALAGTAPFEGETAKEVVKARLEHPAPGIRTYRPDVTEETAMVLKRMLSRSTTRRYPTYSSLLSDLRKATRAARRAAVERKRFAQQQAAAEERAARRRPVQIVLFILLVAGAIGSGTWWWRSTHREPERKIARYILRDGNLIPVYADELEAEAGGGAEEAGAEAAADADRATTEAMLAEAAEALRAGPSMTAMERLSSAFRELDPADPHRAEAGMLQILGSWVDGRPGQATPVVSALRTSIADEGAAAPPGYREILDWLAGSASGEALEAAHREWPSDVRALANLLRGLDAAFQGDPVRARARLEAYETDAETGWTAAFRPTVPEWRKALEAWSRLAGTLDTVPSAEGIESLDALLAGDGRILRPVITDRRQALEARRRQEAAARQATVARQKEQQARDETRAAAAREQVYPLLARGQFSEAAARIEGARAEMETEAGKTALQNERNIVDRLQALRPFLVNVINARPPPNPIRELGGRVARADRTGIYPARVEGGRGKTWEDLSHALFLKLLAYYIEQSDAPAEDRAGIALGAALYCEVVPGLPVSGRDGFARKAVSLDPGLADEVTSLLGTFRSPDPSAPQADNPLNPGEATQ